MGIKPGTIKGWPENDDGVAPFIQPEQWIGGSQEGRLIAIDGVGFFGDGGSAGIGRPIGG